MVNPGSAHIPKVFVVCDQTDTAPVWGYILRQQGLHVILETSLEKAVDRWSTEMPDLVVIDLDVNHEERMELYQKFRAVSVAPILLFLPTYHETEILEAYHAGVDDVVELVRLGQVIDREHVRAARAQRVDQVTADEACCACDQNHV